MLDIDINAEQNLVTLKPSGALSQDDFGRLTALVDSYINDHDRAPNIMIVAEGFPYWDSFKAFTAHSKFIRDHHKAIKKIAIVGDSFLLSVMPSIGDHFVSATVRHFPGDQLDQAHSWVTSDDAKSIA